MGNIRYRTQQLVCGIRQRQQRFFKLGEAGNFPPKDVEQAQIALHPKRSLDLINRVVRTADIVSESLQRCQLDGFVEVLQATAYLWPEAHQVIGGELAASYNSSEICKNFVSGWRCARLRQAFEPARGRGA